MSRTITAAERAAEYADDRETESIRAEVNPFSVRYVRPGAVPFFFEPSYIESLQRKDPGRFEDYFIQSVLLHQETATWIGCQFLADRFERAGMRAQVTGPHGSGKSTLMDALCQAFEERGFSIFSWSLHDRQRFLPADFQEGLEAFLASSPEKNGPSEPKNRRNRIIFLDGFEQLSPWSRFFFRSFCRNRNLGFLLSSHAPAFGLPVLLRAVPSFETLLRVIEYLLDDSPFSPTRGEIQELYLRNRGNFRSILFDLYDRFEDAGERL